MITAKDVKNFIKDIPDDAQVIFSDGFLTFRFDSSTFILNRYRDVHGLPGSHVQPEPRLQGGRPGR